MELLKDFSPGPLDAYRKRASFDWKRMKVLLETEDIIRYKQAMIQALKSQTVFDQNNKDRLTFDEQRYQTFLRMKALGEIPEFKVDNFLEDYRNLSGWLEVLYTWDPSTGIATGVRMGLFSTSIKTLGTEEHLHLAEASDNNQLMGCFTLTEIGHGSNTKMIQTRAMYDPKSAAFVLNTPNFEAAKCWSGLLAQHATHTVLYAQLYTPDGVCHGVHQFVVQIRDGISHLPFPGVLIADMGAKGGLNGVDNGILMFNNYRVPKSALLNRNGDVTKDGVYKPRLKDPKRRFGSSLHALSMGRVNISGVASAMMAKAVTIGIRYAAVRKQFGPGNTALPDDEVPILEYQQHQYRLLPYLATAYVTKVYFYFAVADIMEATANKFLNEEKPDAPERGIEVHALSSASKPFVTAIARDAIQECREACGGHGYLKASGLTDLRGDNDANVTYEGDNNVLIQQTSNWMLKFWPMALQRQNISAPYQSVNFLTNALDILDDRCRYQTIEEFIDLENLTKIYQWLTCHLLKLTHEKVQGHLKKGQSVFDAKNNTQVFFAKELSFAYIQHFILMQFKIFVDNCQEQNLKIVLLRVGALYALFYLEKHVGHLYQGGYFQGQTPRKLLVDSILFLCGILKDEAIALVDAIAPDDFVMNSVLGNSDGQVYQHLQRAFLTGRGNLERVKWWKEIANLKEAKL